MSASWQTWLTWLCGLLAVTFLLTRAWRKRQRPGCGQDCGCPTQNLREQARGPERLGP